MGALAQLVSHKKVNMVKLHDDIFVFERILTEEIIRKGLEIVSDRSRESYGVEEHSEFFELVNSLWFDQVEEKLHAEYFKHIFPEMIPHLKNFCKTDWRDLFFLRYYPENTQNLSSYIHADFSTWTFSAAFVSSKNYVGGRLCFPRQNIKYKLEEGDMVVFPGGLTHVHYTEKIEQGERIVLVGQSMPYKQDHRLGKKI
jgi:hypothetical protein